MIKIILAEDHKIVRNGIKSLLEREPDLTVTGEASNGLEVLDLLANGTEADIVLTDISMPEMSGIAMASTLQTQYPNIQTIVLSMMDNEKYIFEAFEVGVKGYLLKSTSVEEMIFSIHQVAGNKRQIICAELGIRMLQRASRSFAQEFTHDGQQALTSRELEVLTLIAEGYTNNEIADKTFTSRRTVEGHRQSLIDKMGVKNTAQLIKIACKNGIL